MIGIFGVDIVNGGFRRKQQFQTKMAVHVAQCVLNASEPNPQAVTETANGNKRNWISRMKP